MLFHYVMRLCSWIWLPFLAHIFELAARGQYFHVQLVVADERNYSLVRVQGVFSEHRPRPESFGVLEPLEDEGDGGGRGGH